MTTAESLSLADGTYTADVTLSGAPAVQVWNLLQR